MITLLKYLLLGEKIDFQTLMRREALLIDVRTLHEFSQGQVESSINIPLNAISNYLHEIKDSGKPVIVFCRSGVRSAQAAQLLRKAKIEAYNGGAWKQVQKEIKNLPNPY